MIESLGKLTSPNTIRYLMEKYDIHFNKRFGQNFLIDRNIVEKIVEAGQVTPKDVVVEVGPGIGTMTQALGESAGKVYAVEIDEKLFPVLAETLGDYDNVTVVPGDILKTDVAQLTVAQRARGMPLKIVANLPYYITTPIIMGFLESDLDFDRMTFLVQKEVGERICAAPGTKAYGSLTVACGCYAHAKIAFDVPAEVFMPKPKVDSAVITLTRREGAPFQGVDKAAFFRVVKAAFLNRRKTLLNSLSGNLGLPKEILTAALEIAGIDPGIRAERLTEQDFIRLTQALTAIGI